MTGLFSFISWWTELSIDNPNLFSRSWFPVHPVAYAETGYKILSSIKTCQSVNRVHLKCSANKMYLHNRLHWCTGNQVCVNNRLIFSSLRSVST